MRVCIAFAAAVATCLAIGATATGGEEQQSQSFWPSWVEQPPSWVTWLSLIGGVGAFVWQLCEFIVSRGDRSSDRKAAVETFWYQSIVVPRISEPLFNFLVSSASELNTLAKKKYAKGEIDPFKPYLEEFQKSYSGVGAQLLLLRVFDAATYEKLMETLDALDGAISLLCFRATAAIRGEGSDVPRGLDGATAFGTAQSSCLQLLKGLHLRLSE